MKKLVTCGQQFVARGKALSLLLATRLRRSFGGRAGYELRAKRGFTLLLAALVSSVVLSIGIAIFGIAIKQLTLSSMGRESQFAFYAADTAAECALYWDIRHGYFGTTAPTFPATCTNQTSLTILGMRQLNPPYTLSFSTEITTSGKNYCADVVVNKCDGPFVNGGCTHPTPQAIHTTIHADGYNVDCASKGASTRALQRSVELHY